MSEVPGTRCTYINTDLTSARELANVTLKYMLVYGSAATSNGFHHDQVEKIGDAWILARHVCAPNVKAGRSLCPAHSIATRIGYAPFRHSEKKRRAGGHCLYGRKI